MKKIILFAFFTLIFANVKAQSYALNLQKYWWYRYMLVNDFMKIGSECGESIPASGRDINYTRVDWGVDATTRLGNI